LTETEELFQIEKSNSQHKTVEKSNLEIKAKRSLFG